ncbi:hypothetical protein [Arcicella rigui]|uniref:Uncharacterized protein n=1 Tax=Arcicella rigui TaxID=797020 RepID=A0ABU5Q7U8_9BACT|nr:hypothetical protein [Arcicella rigui]MEA5138905.1 hypothetical protein [Arcicella rigui]
MTQKLSHKKNDNPIPLLKKGQYNSYRPEDIKQWGVERFLDTVCAKNDIEVPVLTRRIRIWMLFCVNAYDNFIISYY